MHLFCVASSLNFSFFEKLGNQATALFHSSLYYQKLLKGLFLTKQRSFLVQTNFSTSFSRIFEKTTLQTLVLDISLIKFLPDSKKAISRE